MPKKKIDKKEIISSLQKHKTDVGSSEVQVGILTERIKYLTTHFSTNKKRQTLKYGIKQINYSKKKITRIHEQKRAIYL